MDMFLVHVGCGLDMFLIVSDIWWIEFGYVLGLCGILVDMFWVCFGQLEDMPWIRFW